jgi:hypothetical protein
VPHEAKAMIAGGGGLGTAGSERASHMSHIRGWKLACGISMPPPDP